MAVKIRLKRMGAKKKPFYRVVVIDESFSVRGREVEILGNYNPKLQDNKFNLKKERTLEWIKKGAQPSEKVRILLGKAGILPQVSFEGKPKKKPKEELKKEEIKEEKKEIKPEETKK